MKWTNEVLAALHAGDTTANQIAERLGADAHAIRGALKYLKTRGLVCRTDAYRDRRFTPGAVWALTGEGGRGGMPEQAAPLWTDEMVQRMVDLWNAGHSYTEVANALGEGITRNTVCGRLTRLGLQRRGGAAVRTRPKPKPKPPAVPRAAPKPAPVVWRAGDTIESPGAVVWTLRPFGRCAFPVGGDGADTLSCGNKAMLGVAYCAGHHAMMRTKPTGAWTDRALRRMAGRVG